VSVDRALRNDDENTREIGITMATLNVLRDKLMPLLINTEDDRSELHGVLALKS
jgi:hypothetical protein